MSIQTFLIEDPRISKSAINDVTVGVKSGPASSTVQSTFPTPIHPQMYYLMLMSHQKIL